MRYVDNPAALNQATLAIQAAAWAALDTEADSLHHYIEKLCLTQISVPEEDFVIDPLALPDLKPLMQVLEKKPLLLHGADFDLRLLKKTYGFEPAEIFDTMIAAQLLGYDKRGLADLAHRHCGVVLSKGAQKADWSERPLNETLLAYAANDTHFLPMIVERMTEELKSLGRLEWHQQTCQKLLRSIQAAKEEKADSETIWQIKGSKELKGVALTILRELWRWREEQARRKDRPSFKVLNSETLTDISRWAGENDPADVALMPNLPAGRQGRLPHTLRGQYRDSLNEVIQKARTLPQAVFTRKSGGQKPKSWSEESKQKFVLLKEERDKLGKELAIQPSLLATNATLERLAVELPKNAETLERLDCLMPWQLEVVGPRFLKILLV